MSFLTRIFGRSPQPTSAGDIQKIVSAYGAAMSSRQSIYSDESELPFPKPAIKSALIAAIKTSDDATMREQLKAAYVMLADWQDGIGPGPHSLEVTAADLADPMAAAKRFTAGASLTEVPARAAAEGQTLLAELKSLGL